ncbi:hypothetical protein LDENG_00158000 [Lucifuga dentata]|nr:hypothetical protein LDENG_00158000 [Lucifuga dentata]
MGSLPPSPPVILPIENMNQISRLGHAHGLYPICSLDGNPCQALVDTRATISIVHPGVLPETNSRWPGGWVHTTYIQDPCIIGLDLLQRWGAQVDVSRKVMHLCTETVALHCHQGQVSPRASALLPPSVTTEPRAEQYHRPPLARSANRKRCQSRRRQSLPTSSTLQMAASPPTTLTATQPVDVQLPAPPSAESSDSPLVCAATSSPATVQAVHDLWQHSSKRLDPQQSQQLWDLLHDFTNIFTTLDEECTQTGLVQHSIDTGETTPSPIAIHQTRSSRADNPGNGYSWDNRAFKQPLGCPVILVKKKDGGLQFCLDYSRLNAVTWKDSCPLPRIDDALDYIAGSRWFSSLDLRSSYWQVELALEAKPKTAFTIGQGLWQFRVMPFGLCNTPATFERLMERALAQIPKSHCVVYLDDLLVHATDFEGALGNLCQVFEAIQEAGLHLSPKKCSLLRREAKFLGHVVGAEGVAMNPAKVEAVKDCPVPQSVNKVRSFLELASYYQRFVRNFATIASPLHRLTDKDQGFSWNDSCAATFT